VPAVVHVAVRACPPGDRPLLDHEHDVAVAVQRMLPPLGRERELLRPGVGLAYRLADHIPVPCIPDLHDVVVAEHPLVRHHDLPAVGEVDDAAVHRLGKRLAIVGVAPEQLVGYGERQLVHEQAHLDDRLGPVLLAGALRPQPVLAVGLVQLEVVVGDVVEHHGVPPSELLLHLGVQMFQQVGPPLQQAVHAPVDVLQAVLRVAEEPPLVLPGALLGGRPQQAGVHQVLEDDVEVEFAVQVPAPVVDELVKLQAVVQPRVCGEPEVPAVVGNLQVALPGKAEPDGEVDLVADRLRRGLRLPLEGLHPLDDERLGVYPPGRQVGAVVGLYGGPPLFVLGAGDPACVGDVVGEISVLELCLHQYICHG